MWVDGIERTLRHARVWRLRVGEMRGLRQSHLPASPRVEAIAAVRYVLQAHPQCRGGSETQSEERNE